MPDPEPTSEETAEGEPVVEAPPAATESHDTEPSAKIAQEQDQAAAEVPKADVASESTAEPVAPADATAEHTTKEEATEQKSDQPPQEEHNESTEPKEASDTAGISTENVEEVVAVSTEIIASPPKGDAAMVSSAESLKPPRISVDDAETASEDSADLEVAPTMHLTAEGEGVAAEDASSHEVKKSDADSGDPPHVHDKEDIKTTPLDDTAAKPEEAPQAPEEEPASNMAVDKEPQQDEQKAEHKEATPPTKKEATPPKSEEHPSPAKESAPSASEESVPPKPKESTPPAPKEPTPPPETHETPPPVKQPTPSESKETPLTPPPAKEPSPHPAKEPSPTQIKDASPPQTKEATPPKKKESTPPKPAEPTKTEPHTKKEPTPPKAAEPTKTDTDKTEHLKKPAGPKGRSPSPGPGKKDTLHPSSKGTRARSRSRSRSRSKEPSPSPKAAKATEHPTAPKEDAKKEVKDAKEDKKSIEEKAPSDKDTQGPVAKEAKPAAEEPKEDTKHEDIAKADSTAEATKEPTAEKPKSPEPAKKAPEPDVSESKADAAEKAEAGRPEPAAEPAPTEPVPKAASPVEATDSQAVESSDSSALRKVKSQASASAWTAPPTQRVKSHGDVPSMLRSPAIVIGYKDKEPEIEYSLDHKISPVASYLQQFDEAVATGPFSRKTTAFDEKSRAQSQDRKHQRTRSHRRVGEVVHHDSDNSFVPPGTYRSRLSNASASKLLNDYCQKKNYDLWRVGNYLRDRGYQARVPGRRRIATPMSYSIMYDNKPGQVDRYVSHMADKIEGHRYLPSAFESHYPISQYSMPYSTGYRYWHSSPHSNEPVHRMTRSSYAVAGTEQPWMAPLHAAHVGSIGGMSASYHAGDSGVIRSPSLRY